MKLADRVIKRLRNPERGQRLAPVAERLGEERRGKSCQRARAGDALETACS